MDVRVFDRAHRRAGPSIVRTAFLLLAIALAGWGPAPSEPLQPLRDYLADPAFPDDAFPASTPAAEGLDGAKLEAGLAAALERGHALHAVLVIRHGKRVLERYGRADGRQLTPADDHELHSTTKTVTSMLVGLAIADGKLASVQAPVLPFFEKAPLKDRDPRKAKLTLEDLLTMRSGLEYSEGQDDVYFRVEECSAEAFLGRPLAADPGTHWKYSSGNSQILAEVVRRATGKAPLAYATERIFAPLGVKQVRWMADDGGTQYGGWGLFLRPRDLARFGQLLLAGGTWKGAQLLPAAWVAEATKPRTHTPWAGGDYGYHLWSPSFGGFALRGWMGQLVYAFPDKDLLVVFTAALPGERADAELDRLVAEFVLPAVRK